MAKYKADDDRRLETYNSDSSRNIRVIVLLSAILGAIALISATA